VFAYRGIVLEAYKMLGIVEFPDWIYGEYTVLRIN